MTVRLHDARRSCATLTHRDTERPKKLRACTRRTRPVIGRADQCSCGRQIIQNPNTNTRTIMKYAHTKATTWSQMGVFTSVCDCHRRLTTIQTRWTAASLAGDLSGATTSWSRPTFNFAPFYVGSRRAGVAVQPVGRRHRGKHPISAVWFRREREATFTAEGRNIDEARPALAEVRVHPSRSTPSVVLGFSCGRRTSACRVSARPDPTRWRGPTAR